MSRQVESTTTWTVRIDGMTCDRCARAVDTAVGNVAGVVASHTRAADGVARVVAAPGVSPDAIAAAVRAAGYTVVSVSRAADGDDDDAGDAPLDLLIVGAGSAGFAAAIRARELGARVALVERGALGGTCVNVGCVPSKTLIRAAEVVHRALHHGFAGIRFAPPALDFRAVIEDKRHLVAELQQAKYWDVLAAHPDIRLLRGTARLRADGGVEVDGRPVPARNVLIATGSHPHVPAIRGLADAETVTSTELMDLDERPDRLVVLGGGYVGLELGQTFARFGSRVTVLARSRLLSREEPALGAALADYLRGEGIDVRLGVTIDRVDGVAGALCVQYSDERGSHAIDADHVLVALGRRPNTAGLGLADAGIATGPRGEILVDEHLRTTRSGVYAAGDVTGGPAFVYVAAYAGRLAAEHALTGDAEPYDLSIVPRVTFTDPALAAVGLTETEARARGIDTLVSELPMGHVPRAVAARDTRGVVKLVADAASRRLVGAHILAPEAGDIVQQAALAIRFGARIDDLARMLHPYLTNAEAIKLACQSFDKDVSKLSCCAA